MKKFLTVLLSIAMLLSLCAGCGDNPESSATTAATEAAANGDNGSGSDSSLLAAAEKLKDVSSYQLTLISNYAGSNTAAGSYTSQNIMDFYVQKAADGTSTIQFTTAENLQSNGGEMRQTSGDAGYYAGTIGYRWDTHFNNGTSIKIISDTPFTTAGILKRNEDITVRYDEQSPLGLMDAMETTQTQESDGTILVKVKDVTAEQWCSVYTALSGEEAPEDISQITQCSLEGRIDPQGYLREFALGANTTSEETDTSEMKFSFRIEGINSTVPEEPDFAKNFNIEDAYSVQYLQNGWNAWYSYSSHSGMRFEGFGEYYRDSYTVDCYQVLPEVEGKPVESVSGVLNNTFCDITVERLVIPVGVAVSIGGVYSGNGTEYYTENTTLFFEDAEADVEGLFTTLAESSVEEAKEKDIPLFKAAYYAGQWEYVDGIPTP